MHCLFIAFEVASGLVLLLFLRFWWARFNESVEGAFLLYVDVR